MFKLFGRKEKIDTTKTIYTIKETITILEKRKEYIEKNIENERKKAKDFLNSNKEKAIFHLKKSKMYEKEQKTLEGNIFNLETQKLAIESQLNLQSVIDVFKLSSQTLSEIKPKDIHNVIDNIGELIESQEEISNELSRPIVNFDEDELLQELQDIESSEIKLQQNISLPSVPNHIPIITKTDEEELNELKQLMSQ